MRCACLWLQEYIQYVEQILLRSEQESGEGGGPQTTVLWDWLITQRTLRNTAVDNCCGQKYQEFLTIQWGMQHNGAGGTEAVTGGSI